MIKLILTIFPSISAHLRKMIRTEIQNDVQQNLVTHSAARQSLDLYEMRLETLDTRLAKRIISIEGRIEELEGRQEARRAKVIG